MLLNKLKLTHILNRKIAMNNLEKIDKIFNPESIAVIGASERKESVGYAVMNNLISEGYKGKIFPINPKSPEILNIKAYKSITEINAPVDLAIIATPAKTVVGLIEECGQNNIKAVVIITSGFSEIGEEGKLLEEEIEKTLHKHGIKAVGPNCLGVINPSKHMSASFAGQMPYAGNVGFISQSGALCTSVLDWSIKNKIGFSNFVSIGSMLDLEFSDFIEYFDQDGKTESIIMYIESIKKPEEFIKACKKFTAKKPIFAIKSGRFEEGSKAAASHTGALAGSDDVYDTALKRAGIVRLYKIEDLINVAKGLSSQKLPQGNRLCILTNAGGPGVITTDALVEKGGKLAELSPETVEELNKALPAFWSHNNPVDVLGDALHDRYEQACEICIKDKNNDALMVILTPQAMSLAKETAESISKLSKKYNKPIYTSWMGSSTVDKGVEIFLENGVPSYLYPENAIDAFTNLNKYVELKKSLEVINAYKEEHRNGTDKNAIQDYKKLIESIKLKGERNFLNEIEAKNLVEAYNIPTTKARLATNADEAAKLSEEIGFPVVMKIQSPDILHKTEAGGVKLNIKTTEDAKKAFEEIIKNAKAYNAKANIEGAVVQKMVDLKGGFELIIGLKKDSLWGPTIIFGAGGVNVELLKDKTISLMPLNREIIKEAISNTKIYKLLKGYRGQEGADLGYLEEILLNFAQLIKDFPEIEEIDINPLIIKGKEAYSLDARIIF